MNKNKLKFKYSSPRNDRIKNNNDVGVTSIAGGMWFMYETKKWAIPGTPEYENHTSKGSSNHAPCRSFRKFKRMLRKQPEFIGKLLFASRYVHAELGYEYNIQSVL